MNKFALVIIASLLLSACGSPASPTLTNEQQQAAVASQVAGTLAARPTPTETAIPTPTNTPKPTNTPRPTSTPTLEPSPTPIPEPIKLSGAGSKVVDFDNKFDGATIARITYTGGSNFVVYNYDANGNKIDLLVNTIGHYAGIVPLDFGSDLTTRFQVESSGKWTIEIHSALDADQLTLPGKFEGKGDNVILLPNRKTSPPDVATIHNTGNSNFVVYGYSSSNGRDLLVNEIGNYDGQVVLANDTYLFVVESDGQWSIDITTR